MERSLLIGIAIVMAIIAILYVINASMGFYPDGNELLEMLVTAFLGVALIGITFFIYAGATKEKGPDKFLVDAFESSNKDALNTIIEIKDDFIDSEEIINLEAEGLTIGEFDKGYVLNLGDGKYLYVADEVLPKNNEYKIYYNQNSSMIIFNKKPQKKE